MTNTNAIMTLKRMFAVAGVEHASSHSPRRMHANTLRRNGVDLKVIQEQLGHSSLAVTERYFDVDPLEQQRAIDLDSPYEISFFLSDGCNVLARTK